MTGRTPYPFFAGNVLALAAALALFSFAQAEEHDHDAMAQGGLSLAPQLTLHGFSDVTFALQRSRFKAGGDTTTSGFVLGQFDLYFVSRLGDNLSFLGESVFEMGEGGGSVVDVERVFVKYSWSDLARLSVGRTHTALGYWNEAFHHGALLQPTVERPEALKFEDDGGVLPVHSVGFELSGGARAGSWGWSYVANLANGRGLDRETVQGGGDLNEDKAFGLKLTLATEAAGRLEIGPAFYRDRIPADPGTPSRGNAIGERIPGVHVLYSTASITALAEFYRVRHEDLTTGDVWNHDAWYAIATSKSGRVRPYGGFDRLDFDSGDPFYAPNDQDLSRAIVGLRIEPSPFNAIKLEYRYDWRPFGDDDGLFFQTAFTF